MKDTKHIEYRGNYVQIALTIDISKSSFEQFQILEESYKKNIESHSYIRSLVRNMLSHFLIVRRTRIKNNKIFDEKEYQKYMKAIDNIYSSNLTTMFILADWEMVLIEDKNQYAVHFYFYFPKLEYLMSLSRTIYRDIALDMSVILRCFLSIYSIKIKNIYTAIEYLTRFHPAKKTELNSLRNDSKKSEYTEAEYNRRQFVFEVANYYFKQIKDFVIERKESDIYSKERLYINNFLRISSSAFFNNEHYTLVSIITFDISKENIKFKYKPQIPTKIQIDKDVGKFLLHKSLGDENKK